MKHKLFFFIALLTTVSLSAQCPFDPVVEGDLIFCPNQTTGEIACNLQAADAYQWLSRPFSGGSTTPIAGATNSSLSITNSDILTYFSVEVTINGCTETSPEVLIDQWNFLLPSVETSGDYVFDGTNFLICEGDSMFMTLMNPYDTNITWYRDGAPIPGETDQTLEVTEPGVYTVSGAPAICPNYIQFLGLDLPVQYNTDPNVCDILGVDQNQAAQSVVIYPNPTNDILNVVSQAPIDSLVITDILGQQLYNAGVDGLETAIDISSYARGTYFVLMRIGDDTVTRKVVKE